MMQCIGKYQNNLVSLSMIGIYKITSPSNKIYVGSSINIEKRKKHYINLDCKAQRKLYNSFVKYGYDNHLFEILEECSEVDLFRRENYHGILLNVMDKDIGLNLSLPALGEKKAIISQETLDKMSKSQSGNKNGFFGRKHTTMSLEKMSKAHKNKSLETLNKMRNSQLGKKASEETRLNMSLAQKGRKHTDVTKLRMRENNKNIKIILCLQTGIFYLGTAEASESIDMNRYTLKNKLNGSKPNNTTFTYC